MSDRGFTIIELMIVVGIIGILSAVSLAGWRGYQDNINLRAAARQVMSDIALCKERAVAEGIQYCMQFTDGSPNYSINAPSCGAPTQTQAKNFTNSGSGSGLTIYNTNYNSDQLSFLPRGTLSSNTGTIILTNRKNSTATITTNITGKAYVSFSMR